MSAVLMTLFAVSILGALGMAVYGLRVLVGRWDQPRQHEALLSVPKLPPLNPLQPKAQPQPQPRPRSAAPAPVWVGPSGSAPAPLVAPVGLATPPPIMLPTGLPPMPPTFMPPLPDVAATPAPAPLTFMPPQPGIGAPPSAPAPRAPSPGRQVARALSPRIARGSIPPDYSGSPEVEPDTDPGIALESVLSDTVVQRGARFSVVRSNRR